MGSKKSAHAKKNKKKHARKPVNLTLDPGLRKAGERLSDHLGVRFVRLVDFALREELAKHGVSVEPAPADGAVEGLILAARSADAAAEFH